MTSTDNTPSSEILPDISHLLKPTCFLTLPIQNPPHPFPVSPPADIAADPFLLFRNRFYRQAAEQCRAQLLALASEESSPALAVTNDDANSTAKAREYITKVFRLWTIRQAALLMAGLAGIARDEARHLGDLGSKTYRSMPSGESLVPWALRVLAVRIQGAGDTPQGVTQFYAFTREARSALQSAQIYVKRLTKTREEVAATGGDNAEQELERIDSIIKNAKIQSLKWKARIRNLGLYSAAMLIGMRDTKSTLSLLQSLYEGISPLKKTSQPAPQQTEEDDIFEKINDQEIARFNTRLIFTLAMVYLQIGDSITARQWFARLPSDTPESQTSKALGLAICSIADADWDAAEKALTSALSTIPSSTVPLNNEKQEEKQEDKEQNTPTSHPESLIGSYSPFYVALTNNLSVVKINQGDLLEGISLLENMALTGVISPTVLSNLCILFDLQQEQGRRLKNNLLGKIREQGFLSLENYNFLQ